MSFRAIVVDDEPLAREGLAAELLLRGVEVVAICADGYSARDAFVTHRPDVAFLDIQMPEIDGFALLEMLEPEDTPPVIIFVTAHDQHAVRAFDARALDYLLKPVSAQRLDAAVERATVQLANMRLLRESASSVDAAPWTRSSYIQQLVVRDREKTIVIPVDELEWIEAETYYVRLHSLRGKPRLLRERMAVLESRLDPAQFVRTHRSAIVRLDQVRELRTTSRYEQSVVLASGSVVPLSRERRAALEARLNR